MAPIIVYYSSPGGGPTSPTWGPHSVSSTAGTEWVLSPLLTTGDDLYDDFGITSIKGVDSSSTVTFTFETQTDVTDFIDDLESFTLGTYELDPSDGVAFFGTGAVNTLVFTDQNAFDEVDGDTTVSGEYELTVAIPDLTISGVFDTTSTSSGAADNSPSTSPSLAGISTVIIRGTDGTAQTSFVFDTAANRDAFVAEYPNNSIATLTFGGLTYTTNSLTWDTFGSTTFTAKLDINDWVDLPPDLNSGDSYSITIVSRVAAVPLQTMEVVYTSSSDFTISSNSGVDVWTTEKLDQADVGTGVRLWNGSHAETAGAIDNESRGNRKYEFATNADSGDWWETLWVRMKQDPGTGTYSDWIALEDGLGNIYLSTLRAYNNMGQGVSNYTPSNTWVTHASGFKYIFEVYDNLDRPSGY